MINLRFWALVSIALAASVYPVKELFFYDDFGKMANPFTQFISVEFIAITFNNLGVMFGISGFILWLGRMSPLSNVTAILMLCVGAVSYVLQAIIEPQDLSGSSLLAIFFWPLGVASLLYCLYAIILVWIVRDNNRLQNKEYLYNFIGWTVITWALGLATGSGLDLSRVVLPGTIDVDLYKIDLAFSGFAGNLHNLFLYDLSPFWQTIVLTTYSLLSMLLLLVIPLVLRENREVQLNALRILITPFVVAFMLYCITPVAGPIYTFGADYPSNMDWSLIYAKGVNLVAPTYRNGMPSMHFTGAMLILLATACLTRKIFFYASCVFVAITFIATMALGEHYLLDLIVAMPFCIAFGTALINPPGWNFLHRRVWWLCALLFVVWELGLHFDMTRFFFIDHLNFVRLLSVASATVATWGLVTFLRVVWKMPAPTEAELQETLEGIKAQKIASQISMRWIYGIFVCAGFAGLFYVVIFTKHLGFIFGSTALVSYTVIMTYMGGMAFGGWLGGIIADRACAPLKWFALSEAAIGLYALATPTLFKLVEHIYVALATDVRPDAPILAFWRVVLSAVVFGIPSLLMGATLPIMFKFLRSHLVDRSRIISRLYTANTIGAAFAMLTGVYIVLPTLGLSGSIRLAALSCLMIALYTFERSKTLPVAAKNNTVEVDGLKTDCSILPPREVRHRECTGFAALLLLTVGGVVSLALEIVNIHMLEIIVGNSVYTFGLILTTFLFGIGLGSACYGRLHRLLTDPVLAAIAQLGIFFSIVISAFQWDGLATYLGNFGFMQEFVYLGFGARELIRGVICSIAILPAAFFIGIGYPATMALASDWLKKSGEATGLGIASLCNMLGNITGALLTAFVFLDWIGSNRLLFGLAVISLLLALYMTWVGRVAWLLRFNDHSGRIRFAGAAITLTIIAALWGYPAQWNVTILTNGANLYFANLKYGEIIDVRESIQGGISTVRRMDVEEKSDSKRTATVLMTNGILQGDDFMDIEAQEAFAEVPLLHQPKRGNALVIGYNTGNTAHVLHNAGFAYMDIVELSKDVVELANLHFSRINDKASEKPNVNIYYTDSRNFLLTQNKYYNLIVVDPTNISVANTANLYNREFYKLAKMRLKEDGVLQQGVQLHHMQSLDLLYIINTAHQEFAYVWLYVVGGQGILVASNATQSMSLYHLDGGIVVDAQSLNNQERKLQERMILEPEDVSFLSHKLRIPQYLVSTDNNLYLEYSTPKGNALNDEAFIYNIKMLEKIHNERLGKYTE